MTKTPKRKKGKDYKPTVLHKSQDMTVEQWRKENGIPDWEQKHTYPRGLSRDQIKWEFLRRNYHYKLLYSEFVDDDGVFHRTRPSSNEEEDSVISESEWAAIEYELPDLIDPRIKATDLKGNIFTRHFRGARIKGFYKEGQVVCSGNTQHRTASLISDNRFAVYVFDLRYPLPRQVKTLVLPQLGKLQAKLKKASGIEVKSHDAITRNYIKHLQILDAYSEKAKSVDVGKTALSIKDDKKARDTADKEFKRAMEMWRFF